MAPQEPTTVGQLGSLKRDAAEQLQPQDPKRQKPIIESDKPPNAFRLLDLPA